MIPESNFVTARKSLVVLFFLLFACLSRPASLMAETGEAVVVVYNTRVPESKAVADYYVAARHVPTNQVFGFDLPDTETISRADYRDHLHMPLLNALEKNHLFTFATEDIDVPGQGKQALRRVTQTHIRYAVMCYGVPVRILPDPTLKEEGTDKLPVELRRNEAAVDSELALLPADEHRIRLTGPLPNPFYGVTNAAYMVPQNGILMVSRLDGPSAQIAKGLVDKAMSAETNGMWGRAYFDLRGITSGEYKLGDDWLRTASAACKRFGFETIVDEKAATLPDYFPLSQVAIYAGWYDANASGPFTLPAVEFMPGAFAYHLHSFSANHVRSATSNWVGPLLAKGATITMGSVDEPYLSGTPDIGMFCARFIGLGFSFGEAAYAGQSTLSWQTTVIGDPLYRPFGRKPQLLHDELIARKSEYTPWSHLRFVNLALAIGESPASMIDYLKKVPAEQSGSILYEKLGDLYSNAGKINEAIDAYTAALKLKTTPQQQKRLLLTLGHNLTLFDKHQKAYDVYHEFLKAYPDYTDKLSVYQQLLPVVQELKKIDELDMLKKEINRLTPPPK